LSSESGKDRDRVMVWLSAFPGQEWFILVGNIIVCAARIHKVHFTRQTASKESMRAMLPSSGDLMNFSFFFESPEVV